MTSPAPDPVAIPKDLPVLAVLGITEPSTGDWGRLRGLQYASIGANAVARLLAHSIAALAIAAIFVRSVPIYAIIGWLVALGATLMFTGRHDRSLRDADKRRMSRGEVERQNRYAIMLALVWVIPLAVFWFYGTPIERLEAWTVVALLMVVVAVVLPTIPLGTVTFIALVGISSVASFAINSALIAAVTAAFFTSVVGVASVIAARNFIIARVAESAMVEKAEVVSLLLREFEEGEADWLWQIDTSRRARSVSPRFAFALGLDPEDIEGKPFIQLISGPAWETGQFPSSLHDLAERLKRRESFSNLLVRVTIRGEQRWWELSGTPRLTENGVFDGFRGVGSDVTEQRESSEKIAHMARYDTLTGLPNRMMLTEALADAMKYADQWRTRCAFMMIDLDRFKAVNDTLGHVVGDHLLAQVSARLREQMSENETCGRLGGDEFAIVVRDASDLNRVNEVARRVIARLSQPYEVDHHTLFVGASVGSAIGPRDGNTVETLMRNADLALYRSKDEGGGIHHIYEPTLHAQAEERLRLESSLRKALERGEMVLNFQPVVDARSETVMSFEALLRWNSAEHGFVSPAKFIPLAEETRLIVPIGEWVLRRACEEAMNWPRHVRVAVNVSGEQLLDPNFSASVVGALSHSGLSPDRLEIEVTESIFLRDDNLARAALEQAMALGCSVALDDFGTGYSSLGYLRKLRFSTIKVDRSFVQGAAKGNRESLAIIRAVVAMADSLEMSTTAEGVETLEEAEIVRKLGCKKIQGYYFGRPIPAREATALFMDRQVQLAAPYRG